MNYLLILIIIFTTACSSDLVIEKLGDRTNIVQAKDNSTFVEVANFSKSISLDPIASGWYHHTFNFIDPMNISFQEYKGEKAARFETKNSASMLFRHVDVLLSDYPKISWKWLVEKDIQSSIDEKSGDGDDSAARLYISFKVEGEKDRRLELIWSRSLNRDDKKFTHKFNHYVVRGKNDSKNRWYEEEIDLQKIYNDFWPDQKSARINAISFLCDSDNTKTESIAYFSWLKLMK